ncbi:cobalt-precorrin-6A reductase [Fulvimarina sp. MAC3]|uniref:cobalt-precorrin-6A reductase n=1 Tax=Fulvimarina sp. MAC3 TaxID=3148887 RepID=UPI0031FDE39D
MRVLILGGTSEANALAARLRRETPNADIILSLAGRTREPDLPDRVPVRSGGFGGADGLARYLRDEKIAVLLDATHPFATRIADNAAIAATAEGIPHTKLCRAPWQPKAGEQWLMVASEREAATALPAGARPFIALGRQYLNAFDGRTDLRPVLRMIEQPDSPLGFPADIIRGKPGPTAAAEAELFSAHDITHLVCRNSGGARSYAKVEAARALGIPVVMIARPAAQGARFTLDSIDAAFAWVADHLDRTLKVVG